MGYIKEWIKNGKIKRFKKKLNKIKASVEKQEGTIIGKEKELYSLYGNLEITQNQIDEIKAKLADLGVVIEEAPVAEAVEEETKAIVVKKDSAPVMENVKSDIKVRIGKNVLSLNKISKEEFFDLIEKKYNLMIGAYDKVLKVLYSQVHTGDAESVQRENYINEITKVYNTITSKHGNINIDKAIDFLNSKIDVGIGYELELQKKDEDSSKKYANANYKSLSAFMKNPVMIPSNAMKINVVIRSDINKMNKMSKIAGINIYLFESAKYSREEAKEKFYENNKYDPKYMNMPYEDIIDNNYFYYNQTQCEIIKDKVLAKNTIAKAMYQKELNTGFIEFIEPGLNK